MGLIIIGIVIILFGGLLILSAKDSEAFSHWAGKLALVVGGLIFISCGAMMIIHNNYTFNIHRENYMNGKYDVVTTIKYTENDTTKVVKYILNYQKTK